MNVLHTECGLNWGGQEYRTLIEAKWLNVHGHRAWIACDPRSELFRRGKEQGGPMLPVSMRNNADLKGIATLAKFCKRKKIEIIHTHGPKDSWMCYPFHLAGYTVVRSRHITVPIKPGIQHSFIYRYGCRRVIATAKIIRETLLNVNRLDPSRVDIAGEGIDLNEYHPEVDGTSIRKEFDIPCDAPLIGIIAMMRGDKGHHFFLDAALEVLKTHSHARFMMVGEGIGGRRVEKELRARIENAGEQKRVSMTGYRWDVPQIMAALDIVVVASIEVEAQSRIVPQAFASRKAVVASRVGGIPELVTDRENGLLVAKGSGSTIAQAVVELIENSSLKERIATNGYEYAKKYLSIEQMMEKTLEVYKRAKG